MFCILKLSLFVEALSFLPVFEVLHSISSNFTGAQLLGIVKVNTANNPIDEFYIQGMIDIHTEITVDKRFL